jgi:hypothetical protein
VSRADAARRRDGTRLPVPDRTEAEERAALVRHIAADPVRVQWLRDHVAGVLDRVALAVRESDPPTVDVAAAAIERRAAAHRRGETPLW